MSSWAPTKYKTTNWSAYNEALRQRGSLTIWFDPVPKTGSWIMGEPKMPSKAAIEAAKLSVAPMMDWKSCSKSYLYINVL